MYAYFYMLTICLSQKGLKYWLPGQELKVITRTYRVVYGTEGVKCWVPNRWAKCTSNTLLLKFFNWKHVIVIDSTEIIQPKCSSFEQGMSKPIDIPNVSTPTSLQILLSSLPYKTPFHLPFRSSTLSNTRERLLQSFPTTVISIHRSLDLLQ